MRDDEERRARKKRRKKERRKKERDLPLVYPHAAIGLSPIQLNSLSAMVTFRVYPLTKIPFPSMRVNVEKDTLTFSAPSMKIAPPR